MAEYTLSGSEPNFGGLRGSITIDDDGIEYLRTVNGDISQAVRVRPRSCTLNLTGLTPEEARLAIDTIKAYRTQGDGSPPTWTSTNPEPPLKEPEPAPANGGRFSGLDFL